MFVSRPQRTLPAYLRAIARFVEAKEEKGYLTTYRVFGLRHIAIIVVRGHPSSRPPFETEAS